MVLDFPDDAKVIGRRIRQYLKNTEGKKAPAESAMLLSDGIESDVASKENTSLDDEIIKILKIHLADGEIIEEEVHLAENTTRE